MLIASGLTKETLSATSIVGNASFFKENDDNGAVRRLIAEAESYDPSQHDHQRLDATVLLESMTSLWLLQTVGVPKSVNDRADILATTPEDLLAKALLVKLPGMSNDFPSLDRRPISRDSDSTVHLVLFGLTPLAEAIAINAALVAHYPNFCRDTRLRTRITIVDDSLFTARDHFVQRYSHLFDNSWYRTIDLQSSSPSSRVHRPLYYGSRKDFVDVEFEFVRGDLSNGALQQKLTEWSASPRQQLTVVFCHTDNSRNTEEALSMPDDIYKNSTPLLCYAEEDDLLSLATADDRYSNIIPFGRKNADLNILRTLRDLGRRVNYVYNHCFSLAPGDPITAPAAIDESRLEAMWQGVGSLPKQYSNIFNAMTFGTKMHSIGHDASDWQSYYALSIDEIDTLTEVEHNRWSVEELILGYRPCTDEEQRLVESDVSLKRQLRKQKIHYDLRSFDDLRSDSTGKNVAVYDMALTQAIPLIMKSCTTD